MSSSVIKKLAFAIFVAGVSANLAGQANAQRGFGKVAQGSETRLPIDQALPSIDLPAPSVEGEIADTIPLVDDFVPEIPAVDVTVQAPTELDAIGASEPMPSSTDGYFMNYDTTFCDDDAPVYSTNTWFNRGNWYTEMEAVVLTHDTHRISPVGFVILEPNVAGFTTNDLVIHQFETGAALTLGRFLGRDAAGRDHQVDFTFLGGFDWTGKISVQSQIPDNLDVLNAVIPEFLNANNVEYTYSAEFSSFEMNYNIRTRPGRDQLAMQPNGKWVRHGIGSSMRSVIAGFRALSYRDLVNITSANAAQTSVGQYVVRGHNDMFGVQLGGEIREKYDDWNWGVKGKVGVLLNFVDRLDAVDTATNPLGAFFQDLDLSTDNFDDAEKLSFLAEIDFSGAYQIRPNLHFQAGYKFLYLSGISQTPEQLSLSLTFPKLNVGGASLMHGGSLGFVTTW